MEQEVMTYDEARYMDIGKNGNSDIQLMNVGITSFEESTNPIEKSVHYIGNKSASNKVTGYDNTFAIESDLIKNNAVVDDLYDILRNRKTGTDAQRYIYIVELWNPVLTFAVTEDTTINTSKVYYTRTGSEDDGYVYSKVYEPKATDLTSYYEGTPTTNTYNARKLKVTAVLTGTTNAPGEIKTFAGDLKGAEDFVYGTFNTSTKTFTANS